MYTLTITAKYQVPKVGDEEIARELGLTGETINKMYQERRDFMSEIHPVVVSYITQANMLDDINLSNHFLNWLEAKQGEYR